MKQLYRYLFLTFLMICIYKIGFSQQAISGYMINQKNDTVKCWIYETEYGVPKFELTDKNDFTKIDPDEIKEYKTDNVKNPHVAVSLKPGKRKQFLLRLEGGPVQLFELQRTMSQSAPPMMQPMAAGNISMSVGVGIPTDKKATTLYAAKNIDTLFEIAASGDYSTTLKVTPEQKQSLVTLIADNTDLTERVNSHDDSYTEAIRQIIQEYNSYYSLAEDYLVTSKKDTIRCKLRTPATTYHLYGLPDENFKLQYRLPKTKTFLSVDLDTISEYGFKDSVLTKRQLPGSATWRFLHWIERGHIDLYAYGHFVEDSRYFVSKDNSPLVEIKYDGIDPLKIRTMVLCDIIADDKPVAEELKNAPVFNYHVIAYIVKTYNQFKNGH